MEIVHNAILDAIADKMADNKLITIDPYKHTSRPDDKTLEELAKHGSLQELAFALKDELAILDEELQEVVNELKHGDGEVVLSNDINIEFDLKEKIELLLLIMAGEDEV